MIIRKRKQRRPILGQRCRPNLEVAHGATQEETFDENEP